jgi:diaminopimelate epimerase
MRIGFAKMQACGNDFVIVDDRMGRFEGLESAFARRVCARRYGVGADGLLLARPGRAAGGFGMVFVNADGLIGEMCGNGARCMAAWLRRAGLVDGDATLETAAGEVRVAFGPDDAIALRLPAPHAGRREVLVEVDGAGWRFEEIDVGPPHAVCLITGPDAVSALDAIDVTGVGRAVRTHALFAPRGCNVNFAALAPDASLRLRTYERGVEEETPGCGTGATAAALVAHARGLVPARVRVVTRSGEAVAIDLSDPRSPRLSGTAHFVADGALDDALLRGLTGSDRP